MKTYLWAVLLALLANFIGAFGPIYLKKASFNLSPSFKMLAKNRDLLAGFVFYGVGTVLFIAALKGGEVSVLYPLVGTTYVWVSFFSIRMLGEKMNFYKWSGVLLILLGVFFIGLS